MKNTSYPNFIHLVKMIPVFGTPKYECCYFLYYNIVKFLIKNTGIVSSQLYIFDKYNN